jgi:hypothetical protein
MATTSHPSKSLLAYSILVLPPFCGLLAILHVGQQLESPRSIGGTWIIDHSSSGDPCIDRVLAESQRTLRVSQSGSHADLTFLNETHTSLSLELHGDRVTGVGRDRIFAHCGELVFEARLAPAPGSDTLTGTLRRFGCKDCPITSFRAVRTPHAPRSKH